MSVDSSTRILLYGAGNMGLAVGHAVLKAGVAAESVTVLNSSEESSRRAAGELGVRSAYELYEGDAEQVAQAAVAQARVVVLGVKPYHLASVLPAIADSVEEDTVVLSLAAGVTLATLEGLLGGHRALVRAMPNTPIEVGGGVVALMRGGGVSDADMTLVRELLQESATVLEIPEDKVHAEIAAAGSAPAFFYLVAESMIDEAVAQGLARDVATTLVVETMLGSARILSEKGIRPTEARYAVSSPGGTTVQGVAALEESGIRAAFAKAMRATAQKSRDLEASS